MNQPRNNTFLDSLDETRIRVLWRRTWLGLLWTACVLLAGIVLLATVDYFFELTWTTRAISLASIVILVSMLAARSVLLPILTSSRNRTAIAIENCHSQLGQAVRTLTEYGSESPAELLAQGVAPGLVSALEDDTVQRTGELDLLAFFPWSKFRSAAIVVIILAAAVLAGIVASWQSRLALARSLLSTREYGQLTVEPGDTVVNRGDDVNVQVRIRGRWQPPVTLSWRTENEEDRAWHSRPLSPESIVAGEETETQLATDLEAVSAATEYAVSAGNLQSARFSIQVRDLLMVSAFEVVITPPPYTRLEQSVVPGGDFEAIRGSTAEFRIELSSPCSEVSLVPEVAADATGDDAHESSRTTREMSQQGARWVATFDLDRDEEYCVFARSQDSRLLPDMRFRIHLREDQLPEIRFEKPEEKLEVHPLVEVPLKIHASDDFGIHRVGISYIVDDGEERSLLVEDFPDRTDMPASADETQGSGVTREVLLRLEDLNLSPQQSVTYFAFAEDNAPGKQRRAITDLRFIDIRPFRRIYQTGGT